MRVHHLQGIHFPNCPRRANMNVRPVYAASLIIASLGALSVSAQNLTPLLVDYLVLPVDAYYDEPMTATDDDEAPLTVEPTDTAPAPLQSAPSDNTTAVIADPVKP